jgi:DNA-binding XRE family transcriptional regulator
LKVWPQVKDTKPLGEYFRKFQKDKGLFQVELAKKIGVNEMNIMNWEKGKTNPHKKYIEGLNGVILEIAGVLGVEVG